MMSCQARCATRCHRHLLGARTLMNAMRIATVRRDSSRLAPRADQSNARTCIGANACSQCFLRLIVNVPPFSPSTIPSAEDTVTNFEVCTPRQKRRHERLLCPTAGTPAEVQFPTGAWFAAHTTSHQRDHTASNPRSHGHGARRGQTA